MAVEHRPGAAEPFVEGALSPRGRKALWISMIAGIVIAGAAFAYKVAEFIFTLGSSEVPGFADVPVTVYFIVAAGWGLLLAWAYLSGQFSHAEEAKYSIIEQEEEYERRGE